MCRPGFGSSNCGQCALGYFGYPNCQPCPCNVAGTVDPDMCEGRCECKVGKLYKLGYVFLSENEISKHTVHILWHIEERKEKVENLDNVRKTRANALCIFHYSKR